MTAAAVAMPICWSDLDAGQRRAAAAALAVAVDELVAGGVDRRGVEIAAAANAHRMMLGAEGGWLLLVETPRYHDRAKVPRVRNLEALDVDAEWCAAGEQPLPLPDALRALVDPDGGPAQLERRRAHPRGSRRRRPRGPSPR